MVITTKKWLLVIFVCFAIPASFGLTGFPFEAAIAQNQTGVTNQTGATNQTTATITNITRGDFEELVGSINSARDAMHNNNTHTAYVQLSDAEDQIFDLTHATEDDIAESESVSENQSIVQRLKPVSEGIQNAKTALNEDDNPNALNTLNSASVELLKITQQLPDGEQVGEEEAEPTGEEEGEE